MDGLQGYKAFIRAIEIGSFSAVGREQGISQSTVSKQIASLEATLGVQLFARTTRKVRPTAEALRLYPHVRQLLDALGGMKLPQDGKQDKASGILRMSMPSSFGRKCIMPLLPDFLEQHPQVVDIRFTNLLVDLVEEGLELAIHIGNLPPSTLMARSLGIAQPKLVATPAYLSRRGRPESPVELTAHNCIAYASTTKHSRWEFESEQGRQVVDVSGSVRADDLDAVYDAVLANLGIAQVPDWVIGSDILNGRVEWLLQDYYSVPQPIKFIYPQTRFLSSRARCFIDFVVERLKRY
ncbi:LysR family transcriptional regulator [Undibacterium arcticum]|uniref:LysR family transcriptional regulator n=1 Tax=Undibacterium arcticum TaxID=1762892 RepID=UPI003607C85F